MQALGVDHEIAPANLAAPAFVDAAAHDESLRRTRFDGVSLAVLRWPVDHPVGSSQVRGRHADGVGFLAIWRRGDDTGRSGADVEAIGEDESAVLVGPEGAIEQVLDELRSRTAPRRLRAAA